jgi:UDP-glucose 4-epimerase
LTHLFFPPTPAVCGEPYQASITEAHPCLPVNPYGHSKLAVENALAAYGRPYGLRYVTFRYFNTAGANPDGSRGERHDPETHLMPLVLQVASGHREAIGRIGNNFDTHDGLCIRNYVHVQDLAAAHGLALQRLSAGWLSDAYNLGNGKGPFSD